MSTLRQRRDFISRGWWGTRVGPIKVRLGRSWQTVKIGNVRLTHRRVSGWYFWVGSKRVI